MPSVQLSIDVDELDSPQELFNLLLEIAHEGGRGSVAMADGQGWVLQAFLEPQELGGLRSEVVAKLGDRKVVFGGKRVIMTPEQYDAAYGSV